MSSKIRERARRQVIAAEQWAATVEMERDVAQAEVAELQREVAYLRESVQAAYEVGLLDGRAQ